ncbi:hypothetical protein HZ326_3953 [Fusarium oxysporum f. sp. albedinis]|nr:hypothetical protein HZ326_3953 [Fusarium oxysporum f. sp. albedinis]
MTGKNRPRLIASEYSDAMRRPSPPPFPCWAPHRAPRSSGISPRSPRPDPQRQLPPNHASAPPFEARKVFAVLNLKARRQF